MTQRQARKAATIYAAATLYWTDAIGELQISTEDAEQITAELKRIATALLARYPGVDLPTNPATIIFQEPSDE